MAQFEPLQNVCEYLNALHVYADDARAGRTRTVEASHFCSHVRPDVRQCLIYDSAAKGARLIGIECMIPRHVYETLDAQEQKLWHSHEFEVKSGMLVLPRPADNEPDEWEQMKLKAMEEVIGLYGKTWHFWQVDRGDELPLGTPQLMGSLTESGQVSLDEALQGRNQRLGLDHRVKAGQRAKIP